MSTLADVLRPYWMSGLNEVAGKTTTSFKAWLSEGKFFFQGIDANQNLVFVPANWDEMIRSVAHDINRMGIAAIESIRGIDNPNEVSRSTAWPLIRSYYASFFACHALCRIFSVCVPKIDAPQSRALNKTLAIAGHSNDKIFDELYRVEIDAGSRVFRMSKQTRGPHEDAWKQFGLLLGQLEHAVLSSNSSATTEAERQSVALLLADLKSILQSDNHSQSSNWLSYIRNNINYRHDYGTWYPHDRASKFRSELTGTYTHWKKDPFTVSHYKEDQEILKFSKGSLLTIAVMRELLEEISRRNSKGDSFLTHGALRLLI